MTIEFLFEKNIEIFSFQQNLPTFLIAISLLCYTKVPEKFAHAKFASFVQQFNQISGYPASRKSGRLSGKLNRISGKYKKGRISGTTPVQGYIKQI